MLNYQRVFWSTENLRYCRWGLASLVQTTRRWLDLDNRPGNVRPIFQSGLEMSWGWVGQYLWEPIFCSLNSNSPITHDGNNMWNIVELWRWVNAQSFWGRDLGEENAEMETWKSQNWFQMVQICVNEHLKNTHNLMFKKRPHRARTASAWKVSCLCWVTMTVGMLKGAMTRWPQEMMNG